MEILINIKLVVTFVKMQLVAVVKIIAEFKFICYNYNNKIREEL